LIPAFFSNFVLLSLILICVEISGSLRPPLDWRLVDYASAFSVSFFYRPSAQAQLASAGSKFLIPVSGTDLQSFMPVRRQAESRSPLDYRFAFFYRRSFVSALAMPLLHRFIPPSPVTRGERLFEVIRRASCSFWERCRLLPGELRFCYTLPFFERAI